MIQANELRIGNYIDAANETEIVTEIYEDFSDLYLGEDNIEDYQPIPITKEWLIDLGFEDLGSHEYLIEYDLIMENEYTDKGVWNFCKGDCFIKEIKYIHELQNLYFAIYDKELTKQKPASNR